MNHVEARDCRRLWTAVLWQTLNDALNSADENEQRRADRYLRYDREGFPDVCRLAGLDPGAVRARYIAGKVSIQKHGMLDPRSTRRRGKQDVAA